MTSHNKAGHKNPHIKDVLGKLVGGNQDLE